MIFQEKLIESLNRHGSKTAIHYGKGLISYYELAAVSNRITCSLLRKGIKKGTIIGVGLQDRPDLICSMISIMNAGCIFVAIDPSLPESRLSALTLDLNLQYIISSKESPLNGLTPKVPGLEELFFEDMMNAGQDCNMDDIRYPSYDGQDGLYIYFTSGSTGKPKGILGKNSSLLQFVQWEINTFGVGDGSRVSQLISPYFDAFLRDVFVPLLAGGTICIPPQGKDFFTPESLTNWIDTADINLIHCVPSLFRLMNHTSLEAGNFKSLKYILLSGEKVIPAELTKWYDTFGPAIELVNLYGPTETTMIRSCYRIKPSDVRQVRVPVGLPIDGTEFLITKKNFKPCNVLVPGDLYIISDYITKGYLNAPELTNEKFVRLNAGLPEERLAYKTGDIARLLPDGNIDLLGREDRQIKIRGIRVEPEEIEYILAQSDLVKSALVVHKPEENGDGSLIAFVIRQQHGSAHGHDWKDALLKDLGQQLPAYMMPADLVEVAEYPLLSNGKVDYKSLFNLRTAVPLIAPVNATEEKLLSVWKEILGDKDISTEEKFHVAGGNSLSMMRLIGKIYREFNVRISLSELINHITIKEQAAFIMRSYKDNLLLIPRSEIKSTYNLSSAQERIYYNYALDKNGVAYNLPMAWQLPATFDKDSLEKAIKLLIDRHESLRTVFTSHNGRVFQEVRESIDFSVEEMNDLDEDIAGKGLRELMTKFVRPFDLSKGPLIRCGIAGDRKGAKILLVDIHHIVCDGFSQTILFSDFLSLSNGEPLTPLPIQYKDYAEWEHNFRTTDEYLTYREFWLKSFEGEIPGLDLPVNTIDKIRNIDGGATLNFSIGRDRLDPILANLQEEDISTFSGLFSIFFMFLAQLTGQDDLVVGINTSGRIQHELEDVVGMFAKTLPIRYHLDTTASFRTFARDMHARLVQAISRQMYDLGDIVSELNNKRSIPVKNLFEVIFVFQNFESRKLQGEQPLFTAYEVETTTSKYPISLFAVENTTSFDFRLEYSTAYFSDKDVELIVTQFLTLIGSIQDNVEGSIMDCIGKNELSVGVADHDIQFNL